MAVYSDNFTGAQDRNAFLLNQIITVIDVLLANNNFKNTNTDTMKNTLLLLREHAQGLNIACGNDTTPSVSNAHPQVFDLEN